MRLHSHGAAAEAIAGVIIVLLAPLASGQGCAGGSVSTLTDSIFTERRVVTTEAMGARAAVAADLDGDGDMDVVSASSTDNTVAWYERLADGSYSGKKQITFSSNGARIVTTGDIDADGYVDIVVASYYDNTVGWFKNDGKGHFTNLEGQSQTIIPITRTADDAQGVTVADIDGDGDLDVVSASSGDNTIAWYMNLGRPAAGGQGGRFCEVKYVVDSNAVGARTVVAADIDGDGDVDLASASKDDDTIAWYPNLDGKGSFSQKIIINSTADGAYSLYAIDLDKDGKMDLVTASNADNTVAFYRNLGSSSSSKVTFQYIPIFTNADFVLSVFAADLDGDGDIDVASASYFDDTVRWYENVDGLGNSWTPHSIYTGVNSKGHYVFGEDMDGDGDTDLVAVMNGANEVMLLIASTACDSSVATPTQACCRMEQQWNGTHCEACPPGTYGDPSVAALLQCIPCPTTCPRSAEQPHVPASCHSIPTCSTADQAVATCDCEADHYLDRETDTCASCPDGYVREPTRERTLADDGLSWEGFNVSMCELPLCGVGQYYNTTVSNCSKCPVGTYSAGGAVVECAICEAGFACTSGMLDPCQVGYFSGPGASACSAAPRGTHVPTVAAVQPTPCPAGFYAPDEGMQECHQCPLGSYANGSYVSTADGWLLGADACTACPEATTTANMGSRKMTECVCPEGSYHDCRGSACALNLSNPAEPGFCSPCPVGAECVGPPETPRAMVSGSAGQDLKHRPPQVPPGYMAVGTKVYQCGGTGSACPGSLLFEDYSVMCNSDGYGVACAECVPGMTFDGESCIECGSDGPIGLSLFVAAAIIAAVVLTKSTFPKEPHGQRITMVTIDAYMHDMLLAACLSIAITLWQTTWMFTNMNLNWPQSASSTFGATGMFFDFSIFHLGCADTDDQKGFAVWNTLVGLVMPGVVFGFLAFLAWVGRFAANGARYWPSTPSALSQVLALFGTFFLMIASSAIGVGFQWITHPTGEFSLRKYPYILNSDSEYMTIQFSCAIGILIWCVIGMGAVLRLLWRLQFRGESVAFRLGTVAMVSRYRSETPWWYAFLLFVNLGLGLVGTVAEDGPTQSLYLAIVLTFYLIILISVRPYKSDLCHYADLVSTVGKLLLVVAGQTHTVTGNGEWLILLIIILCYSASFSLILVAVYCRLRLTFMQAATDVSGLGRNMGGRILDRLPHTGDLTDLLPENRESKRITQNSTEEVCRDLQAQVEDLVQRNRSLQEEIVTTSQQVKAASPNQLPVQSAAMQAAAMVSALRGPPVGATPLPLHQAASASPWRGAASTDSVDLQVGEHKEAQQPEQGETPPCEASIAKGDNMAATVGNQEWTNPLLEM